MDHGFQVCLLEQFQVNEEVIGEEDCEEEEELQSARCQILIDPFNLPVNYLTN